MNRAPPLEVSAADNMLCSVKFAGAVKFCKAKKENQVNVYFIYLFLNESFSG